MEIPSELKKYIELARGLYQTGPSHDFSHIERVFKLSLKIGSQEKANLRILGIAALFHDLARAEKAGTMGEKCHAIVSAELAGEILKKYEEPAKIKAICECILTHRYRAGNLPQTMEAKCLFDADKLDSLGAVGVARAYLWLGERGGTVYVSREQWEKTDFQSNRPEDDSLQREWFIKLRHLQDKLYTSTAKEMAVKRSEIMKNFLATLEREIIGEE